LEALFLLSGAVVPMMMLVETVMAVSDKIIKYIFQRIFFVDWQRQLQ
jgi:hypothetical protein